MRTTLFRVACAVQALALAVLCLLGLFAPGFAMSRMTGMDRAWDPSTLSLMRLQTGGDLGLAIGFGLIAWRPLGSLSALILCLTACLGHGLVHLSMAVPGGWDREALLLVLLLVGPLALTALYPLGRALAIYRDAVEPREGRRIVLQLGTIALGVILIGIGAFGVIDSTAAMSYLAGETHPWHSSTLALMKMHTAADIGLGIGLFAAAYRPGASFAALLLGTIAAGAHGMVHVLEEIEGAHSSDNLTPLILLGLVLVVLVGVTPWTRFYQRWAEAIS